MSTQLLNEQLRRYFGSIAEIEHSQQYGSTLNLGLEGRLGENAAGLIQGLFGAKQRGFTGGLGFKLREDLHLDLLGEHLEQKRHFSATDENYWVSQNKYGIGMQYQPLNSWAKLVGVRYDYARSRDSDLADTLLINDTASSYEKYTLQNRFVGAVNRELQLDATFDVGTQSEISIFGGPAHTRSNDGAESTSRFNGGAQFNYYTGQGKTSIGARTVADRSEASLAYEAALGIGNAKWQMGITAVRGAHSDHDTIVGLSLNVPFGEGGRMPNFSRSEPGNFASIEKTLRDEARSFRSTNVTGQEKEVGRTRLLAIDKTGLPSGSSVSASGIITVPLGVAILGLS